MRLMMKVTGIDLNCTEAGSTSRRRRQHKAPAVNHPRPIEKLRYVKSLCNLLRDPMRLTIILCNDKYQNKTLNC